MEELVLLAKVHLANLEVEDLESVIMNTEGGFLNLESK